ncbi:MAG: MurR/RpiR family transcriptional regulator [Coprobacillaceae bacterium]
MRNAFYNLVNFVNTTSMQDVYWSAAKKILENINKIPDSTIVDVAEFCYVSIATISRLCRKLNYESFADFKMDVTMNLNYFNQDAERMQFDHQLPAKEQLYKGKEVFQSHFDNVLNNLKATYEHIQYEDLEKIVDTIHEADRVCFCGNFFTQSVSMQLQIELSYLQKDCVALYPISQQIEMIKQLTKDDVLIVSTISGGFINDNPDILRLISRTPAYKIVITQLENFPYVEQMDMLVNVGTNHHSLIGKFSITYIFEILEAIYHLKYGNKQRG